MRVVWAGLGLLVVAVVFLNRWGEFTPDTVHDLYQAPGRRLLHDLFAWESSPSLGRPNIDVGLLPLDVLVWALRSVGLPAWVVVRLWRAVLLLVAGWGAVRLIDHVRGEGASNPSRVAAAAVYVANPFVVTGAASTPVLLPYALLPWLIVAFGRAVRERGGWGRPALFALFFFLMGGMHGGVVPLLLLLALPAYGAYAVLAEREPVRRVLGAAGKCLLLAAAVSLYWIVPAVLGRAGGTAIARTTERPESVSVASSFAESLRLLGLWTVYGRPGGRLFQPNTAAYVTTPLVVMATFAVPLAAFVSLWWSRARARVLGIALVAIGIPVMVGLFPVDSPSPLGRLLDAAFDDVPGAIAFRTTNKVGPLVALGYAVLIALGVEVAARRAWTPRTRALAAATAAGVVAVAVYPAWSGDLYPRGLRIPDYWHEAAADLDQGADDQRILMLPGEALANYRWGINAPDDVGPSLLSRPFAYRSTVQDGSVFASNFLAALDVTINAEALPAGALSAMARHLGASDILVRNDMAWEDTNGAPPSAIVRQVSDDPRLTLAGVFGEPGQHTVAPGRTATADADRGLPPLEWFRVGGAGGIVRAESLGRTVVVDGDNFAVPELADMGVLTGRAPFLLAGDLSPARLRRALDDGARLAVTDTNRRRRWASQLTGEGYSATLARGDAVEEEGDSPSLTLFPDRPATQSHAVLEGARSVAASQSGSIFGLTPGGRPALAFDGDETTSWIAGDFGSAEGQSITIGFDRPRRVTRLSLRPLVGDGIAIEAARVRAGNQQVPVFFPPLEPEVDVRIPETEAASITVEITKLRGNGRDPVGFTEVVVPGVTVVERVAMPSTLAELTTRLDERGRALMAAAPLDVVMTRQVGRPGSPLDDEEQALRRRFSLPDAREFVVSGTGRPGPGMAEGEVDRLAGLPPEIGATSSSRAFDAVGVRASLALDGDPVTAWVPATRRPNEFIEVTFPPRAIDQVTIAQDVPAGAGAVARIAEVEVSTDGGPPVVAGLPPEGPATVPLPAQTAGRVRVTVRDVEGDGDSVRLSELGIPGLELPERSPAAPLRGCITVATVDGVPVRGALSGSAADLVSGAPVAFGPCAGETLALDAGPHVVDPEPSWVVDRLRFRDDPARAVAVQRAPSLDVISSSPTRTVVRTDGAGDPYVLVAGQSFHDRWRASMDGRDLGPPILVDGYSLGWRIDEPGPHRFVIEYGSQRRVGLALLGSVVALVVVTLLVVRGRRQRSRS